MISSARGFGAPLTVPAGNTAPNASRASFPWASVPSTRETMCCTWLYRSTAMYCGTRARPHRPARAEVEVVQVGPRVDPTQGVVDRERVPRHPAVVPARQDDLERVALDDVRLRGLDARHESLGAHLGPGGLPAEGAAE